MKSLNLGTPVEISEIPVQLKQLWETNETSCRASLLNIAVISRNAARLEANSRIVAEIMRENACRALLVGTVSEPGPVEAWITAHCSLRGSGRKAVCCEQVAFLCPNQSPAAVSRLILANLESDLPFVCWWQDDFDEFWQPEIYEEIDRLVFDSACWSDPPVSARRLLDAHGNRHKPMIFHDLNWGRTFHLRLALAACFDDPAALSLLENVRRVEMVYGRDARLTSSLLLIWIAQRCGWTKANEHGVGYQDGNGRSIEVSASECEKESFAIRSLSLIGKDGSRVSISGDSEAGDLYHGGWTDKDKKTRNPLVMPCDTDKISDLITESLARGASNSTYLPLVRQVAEQ